VTPLHTGTGPIAGATYVRATPDTLRWGRLPVGGDDPIATTASGEIITFDTVSHEGLLGDQGADPVAFFARWGIGPDEILDDVRDLAGTTLGRTGDDGPHAVLGPVAVTGARPGDVLCVEPVDLTYRLPYGIVSNRHGRGVLSGEMPRPHPDGDGEVPPVVSVLARVDADGRGRIDPQVGRPLRFDLRPFLGLVGISPAADTAPSSTPPGTHGGNLDIHHLGVGSRLLLPVQAEGAGLYVGDPHYAQGNGEVALTAFEAPLRASLRVTVLDGADARHLAEVLATPWAETRTHTIVMGFGDTLDEAMRACVRRAVAFVSDTTGADPASALAFLSAAADFEISQAVNLVVGVHCLIRTADLR
jgi:acetamidase/formamidase